MPKGAAKRVETETRNRDSRSFKAAADRLRKMRGTSDESQLPQEEHKRLPPSQAVVLPLFAEKLKAIPEGKPTKFASVAAVLTTYEDFQREMQLALQNLDPLTDNIAIADPSRYSRRREAEQKKYFAKLDNLILAFESYAKYMRALENYSSYIFNENSLKLINKSMSIFVTVFSEQYKDDVDTQAFIVKFNMFLEFINKVVFVKKNHLEVIDNQYWELKDELLRFTSLFGMPKGGVVGSGSNEEVDDKSLQEISALFNPKSKKETEYQALRDMEIKINDLFLFVENKRKVLADMRNIMHNARIVIMESRFLMLVKPDKDVLQKYKNYSISLMFYELEMIKRFKDLSDKHMYLWPYFNEDLLRPQSRQETVLVESIIAESRKALRAMKASYPEKFIPAIEVINKCEEANIEISQGKHINTHLATMAEYVKAGNLSPLVNFFVLSVAVNCYTAKNPLRTNFNRSRIDNLWKDIESQFCLIKQFVDNLKEHKDIFDGELFQFVSNFIVLPHYLQEVIGATEQAFLHCENLFMTADKDNLDFKNEILKMQIKLLDMQDVMLNFAKDKLEKGYATNFYFKTGKEGYFHLWTLKKNQQLMIDGFQNIITEGLPIPAILERNEMIRLRLEAIPLEFISGQRTPQDSDYTSAMSQCELNKFLKQCDKDRKKEEQRKRNLKKSVEKKTEGKTEQEEVCQSDYEDEEVIPDQVAEPTVDQQKDQLAVGMANLLSQLNHDFSVDVVRRGIVEFYPLTLTSDSTESSFQALYLVGECYGKIAYHNINHYGGRELKVIVADCKLALNYYRRAEIVLGKLTDLSVEQRNFYSEWLAISISTHENQVNKYEAKLSAEYEALSLSREEAMKRLGAQWFTNNQRPGWEMSDLSVRRTDVGDAIDSLQYCKRRCKALKVSVGKKPDWSADDSIQAAPEHDSDNSNQDLQEEFDYADDIADKAANAAAGFTRIEEDSQGNEADPSIVVANFAVETPAPVSAAPAPAPTAMTNYHSNEGVTFSKIVDFTKWPPQVCVPSSSTQAFMAIPTLPLATTSSYSQSSSSVCSSPPMVTGSTSPMMPMVPFQPIPMMMPMVQAQPTTGGDPLGQFRRKDGLGGGPMKPFGSSTTAIGVIPYGGGTTGNNTTEMKIPKQTLVVPTNKVDVAQQSR